jgi:acetyl esterase/lipase
MKPPQCWGKNCPLIFRLDSRKASGVCAHHKNLSMPYPRRIPAIALLLSVCAFALSIWIAVPAPNHLIWQLAVGASEWGLWMALAGAFGAVLGLWSLRKSPSKAAVTAIALGLCASALGLYPSVSALKVAQAQGVPLSLNRYVTGVLNRPKGPAPQTVSYLQVDGQNLQLDIFSPPDVTSAARPAVIVVHGGGWDSRDKSDFPQWDYWLNQHGYVVFDIQYRLHPQPNWQTATADVKCAVGWVKQHAQQYGVDPQRLALLGRSAGGHLALLAGYTPGVADLPNACPQAAGGDTSVRAVVGFYAPVDMEWDYNHPANQRVIDGPDTIARLMGGTPETLAAQYATASPIHHVNAKTPPTLLLQSGTDQLVRIENMDRLDAALAAANVPHQSVLIPYAQHGFDYNFDGWGSQIVQPLMLDFLNHHLSAP